MLQLNWYDAAGAVGAALVLSGFYRISVGKWKNKSFWYELDNLIGALLLVIYQFHAGAYISVVVNVIWASVAFRGLTSLTERYKWGGVGKRSRKRA